MALGDNFCVLTLTEHFCVLSLGEYFCVSPIGENFVFRPYVIKLRVFSNQIVCFACRRRIFVFPIYVEMLIRSFKIFKSFLALKNNLIFKDGEENGAPGGGFNQAEDNSQVIFPFFLKSY